MSTAVQWLVGHQFLNPLYFALRRLGLKRKQPTATASVMVAMAVAELHSIRQPGAALLV